MKPYPVELFIFSFFFLYLFVRKKVNSLLVLFSVLAIPYLCSLIYLEPFKNFYILFTLFLLTASLPFMHKDKTQKKYSSLEEMFDIYDYSILLVFGLFFLKDKLPFIYMIKFWR